MGIASEALKNFKGFNLKNMPEVEPLSPGHRACQGCGEVLALRLAMKALGENVVMCSATGCMEIITSPFPQTAWKVPWIHVAFENAAAVASGVESAYKAMNRKGIINQPDVVFVGYGGDGATMDIGIQALSGALERGHNFVYMCFDNEAYMNTGVQRSSSTPYGAWTTTTPNRDWKRMRKKNMVEALVAHRIPYAATASIAYPEDLVRKVQKAKATKGSRFLHIFASCPTGWRMPSELAIKIARMAVQTNIFPLYEVEDGVRYTINFMPRGYLVKEYFHLQGRFKHLTEQDLDQIQEMVNEDWNLLQRKAGIIQE